MSENSIHIFKPRQEIQEKFSIPAIKQNEYLCDGELKTWNGEVSKVYSPICFPDKDNFKEEPIGYYPLLREKEILEILNSSVNAYSNGNGIWPTMSVEERIRCTKNFSEKMKLQKKEVVNLLMWEIGKNLSDSEKEFDRTVEYINDTIESLKELDRASSKFVHEQGIFAQIRRSPFGVVLCMGPYNYPLNETFATLIPALIMGNTVILKPAKYGILLLRPLLEAFRDSFPKGVINTIYGDGKLIVPPLMLSGKIDVLAFIGSATVANSIEKLHPKPNRLKTVFGLGAKNPAIILEDADIDLTVKECVSGTLAFNGQRCTALKILFVHKKIADEFLKKFVDAVNSLKLGLPWDEGAMITPLPEINKCESMDGYVKDATEKGAKILNKNGGDFLKTIFRPAVLFPVTEDMTIYHKEQFGPVVPIVPFDDISIPIRYIEESNVGQQASVFGKDYEVISKLIDPLVNQVSRVNINSQCQRGPDSFPFTGRKDSADGTLSVSDALRVFSIRTLVAAKDSDLNKEIFSKIIKSRKSKFLSTDFIF
ncbi:MAG: NADP-dependent glyceraldehyde-3-phosphate dehydrogenase [Leptospiraceae bacterium]|nr:NADP-dependent glyceraldehyde-3-phosphate dehydrogenase [Leptospiraceae bacterium]MCK6382296.1 NADP-dependent glyceraldehyde-3-phosphate dehydrogenase [Leptospiraceae bacterium]NUM41197.1 NADP-dependent glyceraldehyde-3-phosphate dehydrogenase [Leptospiraceae bacterium]